MFSKEQEDRFKAICKDKRSRNQANFNSRGHNRRPFNRGRGRGRGMSHADRPQLKCYGCGKIGHKQRDCSDK